MPRLLKSDRAGDGQALVLAFLGYMYLLFTVVMCVELFAGMAVVSGALSAIAFFGTKQGRLALAARVATYVVVILFVAFGMYGPPLVNHRSR